MTEPSVGVKSPVRVPFVGAVFGVTVVWKLPGSLTVLLLVALPSDKFAFSTSVKSALVKLNSHNSDHYKVNIKPLTVLICQDDIVRSFIKRPLKQQLLMFEVVRIALEI